MYYSKIPSGIPLQSKHSYRDCFSGFCNSYYSFKDSREDFCREFSENSYYFKDSFRNFEFLKHEVFQEDSQQEFSEES